MRLSEGAWLTLLVPLPLATLDVGLSHVREISQSTRPVTERQRLGVFLHVRLPWRHLDTGKRKQGRKHPGRGLCPSQEVDTVTSPQGRESTAQESLRDLAARKQIDGALRTDTDHWHAPCWGAEGEHTRESLGEEFRSPYPILLSPDLPLAEAGLTAEVWAEPRAQICTGLSMTVGTEQSWWPRSCGWGHTHRPGSVPFPPPSHYLSPCGEMKPGQNACAPGPPPLF